MRKPSVIGLQIARDIARRHPRSTGRRNHRMGVILAHAFALRQGLRCGGCGAWVVPGQ